MLCVVARGGGWGGEELGGGMGGVTASDVTRRATLGPLLRQLRCFWCVGSWLLGDSGGVVNSLDFCPASLKSLGCFYFRCVLSSQWKAVTVNLRILHCQL